MAQSDASPRIAPWWGVPAEEEQLSAAIWRAGGVSLGANLEQSGGSGLPPAALRQPAVWGSHRPGTGADCSAAGEMRGGGRR